MSTVKKITARQVSVKLADIKETFFVRKEFNEDRILFFWNILESGGELDPLLISSKKELIDGRHRKRAYELAGVKESPAIISDSETNTDKIKEAFSSNVTQGPMPPVFQDYVKCAYSLLEERVSVSKILEFLTAHIPKSMAKKATDQARFALNRDRLNKARFAVTEGNKTVVDAANLYSVNIDDLKELIEGKKTKKSNRGIREYINNITTQFKSHGAKWSSILKKAKAAFDDGEISQKQYLEVLDHIEQNMKTAMSSLNGWKKRLEESSKKETY